MQTRFRGATLDPFLRPSEVLFFRWPGPLFPVVLFNDPAEQTYGLQVFDDDPKAGVS